MKKKLLDKKKIKNSTFKLYGVYYTERIRKDYTIESIFPVGYELEIIDEDGTTFKKYFENSFQVREYLKSLLK